VTHMEPHREINLSGARLPPVPVVYHSKSEAGVASVLTAFIPNWKPVMDDTVQIHLGGGRTVDFRVGRILLEYHPILLVREMRSDKAKALLEGIRPSLDDRQRQQVGEILREELIEQYQHRRWQLVSCSKYAGHGLMVVQSVEELHARALPKMLRKVPTLAEVKKVYWDGMGAQ
jgi:hypothetical protein